MKGFLRKHASEAVAFLLAAALLLAVCLWPSEEKTGSAQTAKRVVRVWNVDTFEGGRGSRTSFLQSAARRAEKASGEVCYLVSSYTAEGARDALARGDFPDAISFGVGLSDFAELSLPLPRSFPGGEVDGKTLAFPWCRGGYALFSLSENFEEEGPCAISRGGSNLPEVAASLAGIEGDVLPSLEAYSAFLGGKYRYLLGTQRDLCRFSTRGVAVFSRPLPAFCDLYQYFSVLRASAREDALALLDELLSERTRERLDGIGMLPPTAEDETLPLARSTVGAFASSEALREIARAAEEGKKMENYLKSI